METDPGLWFVVGLTDSALVSSASATVELFDVTDGSCTQLAVRKEHTRANVTALRELFTNKVLNLLQLALRRLIKTLGIQRNKFFGILNHLSFVIANTRIDAAPETNRHQQDKKYKSHDRGKLPRPTSTRK